jgi:hypothetical protein
MPTVSTCQQAWYLNLNMHTSLFFIQKRRLSFNLSLVETRFSPHIFTVFVSTV